MKTIFNKNHGFKSHFILLYIYHFLNFQLTGDFVFYNVFFNFSNFCYLSYFLCFFLESFISIYILYQIIFFYENRTSFMPYYLKFIYFLFLLILTYFIINFYLINYTLIGSALIYNKYTFFSKFIILVLMVGILIICSKKFTIEPNKISLNELPCLLSFLMLFICILLSSYDLFIIYLCIEGVSLVVYTLGSLMNKSLINLEAIIKYFLVNNMASSLLLWSISYTYVLIGTTDCFELQYFLISNTENIISNQHFYFLSLIIIISITFKLALFPFQWWIVDVFEGLWTPITLIYAVLLKVTFFLFFFKLIWSFFYSIIFFLQPFLWLSAVGSIIYGSIGALIQVKIKRFLAYHLYSPIWLYFDGSCM